MIHHQSNSQWSEFDVELGGGEDIFYYQINKAATSNQLRDVDGGDGIDSLILYNSDDSYYFDNNDLTVSHFEVIAANTVNHNYTFTLNEELLQDNNDNELGLIVAGLNIEFSDQYDSLSVDTLTDTQEAYLEANLPSSYRHANLDDYYAVTVTYDDQTYTLITTNISSFWTDLP